MTTFRLIVAPFESDFEDYIEDECMHELVSYKCIDAIKDYVDQCRSVDDGLPKSIYIYSDLFKSMESRMEIINYIKSMYGEENCVVDIYLVMEYINLDDLSKVEKIADLEFPVIYLEQANNVHINHDEQDYMKAVEPLDYDRIASFYSHEENSRTVDLLRNVSNSFDYGYLMATAYWNVSRAFCSQVNPNLSAYIFMMDSIWREDNLKLNSRTVLTDSYMVYMNYHTACMIQLQNYDYNQYYLTMDINPAIKEASLPYIFRVEEFQRMLKAVKEAE